MRSILAGLRRLVVPWGASGATPRVVIDSDDPFIQELSADTGILLYWDQGRAFMISVENSGGVLGQFRISGVSDVPGESSWLQGFQMDHDPTNAVDGNEITIGRDTTNVTFFADNVNIGGIFGSTQLVVRNGADFEAPDGTSDMIAIGSNNNPGNNISAFDDRLTLYGLNPDGSDGVQLRVQDSGGIFWSGLRTDTDAQLYAARDKWFTTGSAANVRILTGDPGTDAKIALSTSSGQFKRDVETTSIPPAVVMALRPVRYRDISDPSPDAPWHIGLIAEEVQSHLPTAVDEDEHGEPFSVDYQKITTALLSVVQEQQRTIESLESRIAALENGQ